MTRKRHTEEQIIAVLKDAMKLAQHLSRFPYGHNANGCLEYREEVKAEAQRLLAQLKG